MKRCSIAYVIKKMQSKTTKCATLTTTNTGEDMEQQERSFTAGGNAE